MFHSLLISVLENTASVSILTEHTSYSGQKDFREKKIWICAQIKIMHNSSNSYQVRTLSL